MPGHHGISDPGEVVVKAAIENNIEIIDATCPVVLRLQKRIRQGYLADSDKEKQIVIYGKSGHAEVLGLVGQTDGKAIVIEKAEEAKKLDLNKSISHRLPSHWTSFRKSWNTSSNIFHRRRLSNIMILSVVRLPTGCLSSGNLRLHTI